MRSDAGACGLQNVPKLPVTQFRRDRTERIGGNIVFVVKEGDPFVRKGEFAVVANDVLEKCSFFPVGAVGFGKPFHLPEFCIDELVQSRLKPGYENVCWLRTSLSPRAEAEG